jgi:LuxR family maltose regulon positive regulatory protein
LVSRLRALLGAPLVLVQAPAGSGKTALAAEFAGALRGTGAEEAYRVAWLSLEDTESDALRFWKAVTEAADIAWDGGTEAGGSGTAPPFSQARAALDAFPAPTGLEAAATFLSAIPLDARLLIVLDDFQCLTSACLARDLAIIAERLPRGVTFLMLTRKLPELPLPRLRGKGLLAELDASDLRMDDKEATAFLAEATSRELAPAEASAINAWLGGWAAGLRLASVAMAGHADSPAGSPAILASDGQAGRLLSDYLADELLAVLEAGLKDFLLLSAAFDRFDPALCDACFETPGGAAAMIEQAQRRGLFVRTLDGQPALQCYEPFFRDTLREKRWGADPEGLSRLLAKAAAIMEARGEGNEAMRLWLRGGEADKAARLLESPGYLAQADLSAISAVLGFVGQERVKASPRLLELSLWVAMYTKPLAEAEDWLERTTAALQGRPVPPSLAASLHLGTAHVMLRRGRYALALDESAAAGMDGGSGRAIRRIAPLIEGLSLRMLGRHEESLARFKAMEAAGTAEGSGQTVARAAAEGARGLLVAGRLMAAKVALGPVRSGLGAVPLSAAIYFRTTWAELLYEEDLLEAAEAEARAAFSCARDWGSPEILAAAAAPLIRSLVAQGRLGEASETSDIADAALEEALVDGADSSGLEDAIIHLWLARGEARTTGPAGRNGPGPGAERSKAPAGSMPDCLARLSDLRSRLARGETAEAAPEALSLAEAARAFPSIAIRASCIEALCREAEGEPADAFDAMLRALESAGDEPFTRSYLEFGPQLLPLVERAATAAEAGVRRRAERLLAAFASRGMVGGGTQVRRCPFAISAREVEVLGLLALGLSNRELAERLFISEATVKTHLHHLAEKLGAGSRLSILAKARAFGLIPGDGPGPINHRINRKSDRTDQG